MKQDLYAAKSVWDQPMQQGQTNLLQALCDFWPKDITSVLDVGCGDGKLTARLAQYANTSRFIGLDSSVEALSRLPFSRVKGEAQALPFTDAAFDLVMSTDTLEHLEDAQENAAWQELFRVAEKVVMVAVPFREYLPEAFARCPSCGHVYHVNWHQRSYDIADLHRRAPAGWQVKETILSGEPWSTWLPPEIHLRRTALAEYAGWDLSVCPACGANGSVPDSIKPLPTLLAQSIAAMMIYPQLRQQRWCRSHSEILVIFQRQAQVSLNLQHAPPAILEQAATCIDFSQTPAQTNFAPFTQVAHYVTNENNQLLLQFPLYDPDPALEVIRKPDTQGSLHLLIHDIQGVLFDGIVLDADQKRATLTLPRPPIAGHYGVLGMCAADAFASIRLGNGPNILWLQPNAPKTATYWQTHYADTPLWVQVCAALWLDPQTLMNEAPASAQRPPQFDTSVVSVIAHMSQLHEALQAHHQELQAHHQKLQAHHQKLQAHHQEWMTHPLKKGFRHLVNKLQKNPKGK